MAINVKNRIKRIAEKAPMVSKGIVGAFYIL